MVVLVWAHTNMESQEGGKGGMGDIRVQSCKRERNELVEVSPLLAS